MTIKLIVLQVGISAIAIALGLIHLFKPNLSIDGVTVTLFFIAIIPWLTPLFKSLELPGGWKVEYRDLEKAGNRASKAGLLSNTLSNIDKNFSFRLIADQDPNLALAGLRIEIEKRLAKLAKNLNIPVENKNVRWLITRLADSQKLSPDESSVLFDIIGLLNSAVHGATVDKLSVDWAMDIGPRLLSNLENRIVNSEKIIS